MKLPTDGQNDGRAVEQKLHILLYKSTLTENDLNRALDELRTERRRQKAEYQGAPFADVFLVNLILSDEDSERACIVDVHLRRSLLYNFIVHETLPAVILLLR